MPLPDRRLSSPADALSSAEPGAALAAAPATKRAKNGDDSAKKAKPVVKTADKQAKLGLKSDIYLVLHLPMRYEDETSLTPIAERLSRPRRHNGFI